MDRIQQISRGLEQRARRAALGAAAGVAAVATALGVAAATVPQSPEEVWAQLPVSATDVPVAAVAGGVEVPVSDAGEVGGSWRVVVLFDQQLSEPWQLRNGAVMLAERAAELAALGRVEVVLAGEEGVRSALPSTDAAAALDEALAWIRVRETSRHLQRERRRDFSERTQPTLAAAEAAASGEREELARHLDRLLAWAADAARAGPQLLVWVGGGFDADPGVFYSGVAEAAEGMPRAVAAGPDPAELGRALSVLGWTVVPFRPEARGDQLLTAEETEPGMKQLEQIFEEERGLSPAVGVDPRKLGRREDEGEKTLPLLADPMAPLATLAESTGGVVIADPLQLAAATETFRQRRRLLLELPSPAVEPTAVRLTLAAEEDRPITARRWIGSRLPQPVSAARARQLLRDELEEGDFWVEAVLEEVEGDDPVLTLRIEPEAAARELRLTVAALGADGAARLLHRSLTGSGAAAPGAEEASYSLPVTLPPGSDYPIAVLVEELTGNGRGATFATLRESSEHQAAVAATTFVSEPRAVHLLAPEADMVMGPTGFRALVAEEEVARVEFFLDGEPAGERLEPPYQVTVDLGQLPRSRRLVAVAFGAGGNELGRDTLLVNGGSGMLEVRISQPRPPATGSPGRPLVGPVDVEADVRVPQGARLDRVEFFWRDRLVATRYAPPFRERVEVGAAAPRGFVRVVAHLTDGTSGEDVVFLNSPGPSERLEVDLVELYVVVADGAGRPVRGLPASRFRVYEDGRPVEIATFGDAGDLPLTVGLAIDSSASMFIKLPRVQRAAAEFVRGLERRRDRAFLVSFGRQPRLTRTATTDLPQVVQALDRLRPDGQTAIWEAVVLSLVQLQGVPGKKALIVYSDGADEDPEFSYRTCLKFARMVGAPIYVILSNNEIVRTGGRGLNVRGFLGRLRELTGEVGGRVYLTRVGADLETVYREIAEELRSQYFVGYYSQEGDSQSWRRLEVEVEGVGLSARTISGFFR